MIRFKCTACRAVMKIAAGISEPKKVRCHGCGILILLSPHPINPHEVVPSYPKKTNKRPEMPEARKRLILWSVMGVLVALLIYLLWIASSGPSERAAIEGEVLVDGAPLERGAIKFMLQDEKKPIVATIAVIQGRYSARTGSGPGIGPNRVEITGEGTDVAACYNAESKLACDIAMGENKQDFAVKSK